MSPESFATCLRNRIRAQHNGALPSASELARALNHVDQWRRPVSTETMRRWIRGLSLPELHRVPALCEWLGCTPSDLFLLASSGGTAAATDGAADLTDRADLGPTGSQGHAATQTLMESLRQRIDGTLALMGIAELEALLLVLGDRSAKRHTEDF